MMFPEPCKQNRPELAACRCRALYVHIPFCAAKCRYCDFYSVPFDPEDMIWAAYRIEITPEGGLAASAGALGAALSAMVCRLWVGKKKYAAVKDELTEVRDRADKLREELTKLIDTDKEAFNRVMDAFGLPKSTDEEQAARTEAIQTATKGAASVPLTVMKKSLEVLNLAETVAAKGNENSITDAGVAGLMASAAVEGAGYNVRINLTSIDDKEFVANLKSEVASIRKETEAAAVRIKDLVESKL